MNDKSHFSEEEIAMCADAINDGIYDQLPENFRKHLSVCEQCASEVLMVADIAFNFNINEQQQKSGRLRRWIIAASISSAAAVLIFAIYTLSLPDSNMTSNKAMIVQSDTLAKTSVIEDSLIQVNENEPSKKLIASLEPNEKLEKLYQNHQESYRTNSIQIITKGEVAYPAIDSLKWVNKTNDKLTVEFFNNRDREIKSIETSSSSVKIPKLGTGIYYWKLINEDYDLLYVGKIMVK